MDEKLRKEGYELLMELAKDPDYLISLAKIGAKARESSEKLKQALTPEPRFYVGQPVLVRDYDHNVWLPGNLEEIIDNQNGYIYQITGGHCFKQCKPDLDDVSQPNWIEHDGSDFIIDLEYSKIIVWIDGEGNNYSAMGDDLRLNSVARYCIIPLPEFIVQ